MNTIFLKLDLKIKQSFLKWAILLLGQRLQRLEELRIERQTHSGKVIPLGNIRSIGVE